MEITRTVAAYRAQRSRWQGERLGFIPTMGALHQGHLALVKAAQQTCTKVVVSIFVNPIQFGVNEDLSRYPRQEQADCALLQAHGVDAVFIPSVSEMYPPDVPASIIDVGEAGRVLCGAHRPGHFNGVATVVMALWQIIQPDAAFFGEKDWQQFCIIKNLAKFFNVELDVLGVPTVREADGLALSSRNIYLNEKQRVIAAYLYKTLQNVSHGTIDKAIAEQQLITEGFSKVDYIEPYQGRLCGAAWLGQTRLIDNVPITHNRLQ